MRIKGSAKIINGYESHDLEQLIMNVLRNEDGLTDRELADRLKGEGLSFYFCQDLCLQLAAKGHIKREIHQNNLLINQIAKGEEVNEPEQMILQLLSDEDGLTDKELTNRMKERGISSCACLKMCYQLAGKGLIKRVSIKGGPLENRLTKSEEENGLEQIILQLLGDEEGLTDKELANRLNGRGISSYVCLNLCYQLASKGLIKRISVKGKPLVNRVI